MFKTRGEKVGGRRPAPARRIVQFRRRYSVERGRRVRRPPAPAHSAATSPCVLRVQWRCCRSPSIPQSPDRILPRLPDSRRGVDAAGHQDLSIRQQRRRVEVTCGGHATGRRPCAQSPDRIVPRLPRRSATAAPPATSTCPFGSNVAVWSVAGSGHAAGRCPHPSRRIV